GPPPPPPPAASKKIASGGGDSKNDLMAALNDPNLRNRLKKRAPPVEKSFVAQPAAPQRSPEEEKMMMEAEKQELFIELLGFMEAPNGNVEELLQKMVTATKTVRSYIFLLIRRKWLDGVRVIDESLGKPEKPCIVWQNMEVTTYIELKDVHERELKEAFEDEESVNRGIVGRVRMYRYDEKHRKHITDEIALMKTRHFPKQTRKFDLPEPPGKEVSLEQRKKHDEWFQKKQEYMQSDFPQFELIFKKLLVADETVISTNAQLVQTLDEMKRMGEALNETFQGFSPAQLKNIIEQIPKRVRKIAKELEESTGILIKADKITPGFLQKMNLSADDPTGLKRQSAVAAAEAAVAAEASKVASAPTPAPTPPPPAADALVQSAPPKEAAKVDLPVSANAAVANGATPAAEVTPKTGMITMAGVPIDVLIPLLKNSYSVENKNVLVVVRDV
ncbi:hypothetical protein HK100_008062, partial [Physocladia obscura]